MTENTITLDTANFDQSVAGGTPILVDFWAEWCPPCHLIAPILDEMATEYTGRLRIGKLNVDENPRIQGQFDVMSIPTLILFQDGVEKKRMIGARPKHALVSELKEYLA